MKSIRCFAVLIAVAAAGCGGSKPQIDTAAAAVAPTLRDFQSLANDVKAKSGDAAAFAELFAEAPPEKDRSKYGNFTWTVESFPQQAGNDVSAKVSPSDVNGTELAPIDWKFRKVGDKWKIASAPLPKSDKPTKRDQQQRERD